MIDFSKRMLLLGLTGFLTGLLSFTPVDGPSLTAAELVKVQQGELILRELSTGDLPGQTFEAIGMMNASLDGIVEILVACERYPEFMPNIKDVKKIEEKGDTSVLNFYLELPLGIEKRYRIEVSFIDQDSLNARVEWVLVPWQGLKANETIKDTKGFWQIEETSPSRTLVWYQVYSDPGPVPFGFGWIVDVLTKNSFPKAFLTTKIRAENLDFKHKSD